MNSRRAPLGIIAVGLVLMASVDASAQRSRSAREETVDLALSVESCVAHLEERLRDIILIELRTSARVDEHAARSQFQAWVRCVEGGVVLEVRSDDGDSEAEQFLAASALRGPDPARTLALSIVELLEPALAEADPSAEATSDEPTDADADDDDADADADDGEGDNPAGDDAGPFARADHAWGLAAALVWRPPFGNHPHTGGASLRVLHTFGEHVRLELGAQFERGGRHVSLGRVAITSLALDASVLTPIVNSKTVALAAGLGARLGGVWWRGRPNDVDVVASRFRAFQLELIARVVVDWYVAERWALRGELELGGALASSRAAAVANGASNRVSVSGFRLALGLGVVHAF